MTGLIRFVLRFLAFLVLYHVPSVARFASSDEWSVPLFLWQTIDSPTYHTALLPRSPSTYINDKMGVNNSWSKVFEDPMCYAVTADSPDQPASYPFVTLKVFYSEGLADIQTTTSSLSELNRHGGQYQYLETIGNIRSMPGSGFDASNFVPLTISYDEVSTDSVTAPLSYEDLNILLQLPEQSLKTYRYGSITGIVGNKPFPTSLLLHLFSSYPIFGFYFNASSINKPPPPPPPPPPP